MSPANPRARLVVPKTSRKEIILGVTIGLAVIAGLIFGLLRLSGSAVEGTLSGTITAKRFLPYPPETQISVGSSGLNRDESNGDYTLTVHVAAPAKDYTVWVDRTVYDAKRAGDSFSFPRPAPAPSATP